MKPLLSKLFLPCSGMHSPIRANRYPLTTITGAQRASGQTHSRARSHQGDADLSADRSTAYLVSCIRVRSAHGNSLDHLVGASQHHRRNVEGDSPRGLETDHQFETGRLLDWKITRVCAAYDLVYVKCGASPQIGTAGPIARESPLHHEFARFTDHRQS